jgi:hypothetical protein
MAMTEPAAPPITDDDARPKGATSVDGTVRECSFPGCTHLWTPKPGDSPNRRRCDQHLGQRTPDKPKAPEPAAGTGWTLEDAISAPLSNVEADLAKRISILVRLLSGVVYRMNVIDGLIIGHHADGIAQGLVIEARTSETVKKMVDAMATFSGAGPLAITLVSMSMEIAANHHVPIIGDVSKVPVKVREEAARIEEVRAARRGAKPPAPAPAVHGHSQNGMLFADCPNCNRRVSGLPGQRRQCICGNAITLQGA